MPRAKPSNTPRPGTRDPAPNPPLDCLAIGAHPDDAELLAGGTLALALRHGRRVGILDLTRGEAGTRGTPRTRAREAAAAAAALGLTVRQTLDLGDGRLDSSEARRRALVAALRRLRPRLVITHWPDERNPDHKAAHELVRDAVFLANVGGYAAPEKTPLPRWHIEAVAFGLGYPRQPDPRADWVVDVSETFQTKLAALRCYATQFLVPEDLPAAEAAEGGNRAASQADPAQATYMASAAFWDRVQTRSRTWGHLIGAAHGEPFILDRPAHAGHPLVRLVM